MAEEKKDKAVLRKKRKQQRNLLIALLIILVICLGVLIGLLIWKTVGTSKEKGPTTQVSSNSIQPSTQSQTETEPEFQEFDIKLMAIGDSLMHMGVVNSGVQEDGSRNYDYFFDGIKDFLKIADMKVINQETIFGGNDKGFSGYPEFNSPTEMGDSIAKAGFNIVLHASNHSNDKGLEGLLNCINYWETKHPDVTVLGIHSKKEDLNKIRTMEINGVTFALLNYTYSTNSDIVPADTSEYLNMLCAYDEEYRLDMDTLNAQVLEDIKAAEQIADFVIVFPHWGLEYHLEETGVQQRMAKEMTEAGADLIIGTHPHVIEPVKWVEADNGNKALCYYSLGNYVSTQKRADTMLEGMAWVTLHVTEEGVSIDEKNTGALPLVNHYTSNPTTIRNIYLLEDYTQELANQHGITPNTNGEVKLSIEEFNKWSQDCFGDFLLTRDKILNPVP